MALYRIDQWIKNVLGPAVAGAHVYVCTQPATVPATEQTGGPTPLANLFTDSTGATPVVQPLSSDGLGHVATYVGQGTYTFAVYNNGNLMVSLPDQTVGGITNLNGLDGGITIASAGGCTVRVVGSTILISVP